MAESEDNFFSRWSRRKVLVREGVPVAALPEVAPAPAAMSTPAPPHAVAPARPPATVAPQPPEAAPNAAPAPPAPTLAEVAELTTQSDYTRFVAQGVAPEVKNAALKKLFTDPHFNVMDGLDIYIDDYGKPDPLPSGMLRKMVQSQMLRLFDDEPEDTPAATGAPDNVAPDTGAPRTIAPPAPTAATPSTAAPEPSLPDEDLAVQLQPDPAAGRLGPEPGPGENPWHQH